MIPSSLLLLLVAVDPVADLTGPAMTEPPEDAQMGDGLRVSEPQDEMEPRAVTCADGTTLKGVDISKWQGDVNWTSIANSGVKFAFVRVSDGLNSLDQKFDYLMSSIELVFVDQNVFESEIIFSKNIAIKLGFKKGVIDYFIENFGKKTRAEFKEIALKDYI